MLVKIEKTFQISEPKEKVWKFLRDPRKVVTCVPGARITEAIDERTYRGSISVKVGPSVTDYTGEVRVERLDEKSYELELVGKGRDVRGKGSASMKMTGKLRDLPGGGTEVIGISEVTIVGVLAQLGARMINVVSDTVFEEFTRNFQRQLQPAADAGGEEVGGPAPSQPIQAIPLVLMALWRPVARFFRRIIGGSSPS